VIWPHNWGDIFFTDAQPVRVAKRPKRKPMSQREYAQFRATAGAHQAFGPTPQQALGALLSLLPDDAQLPIVIWPYERGDHFFSDAQQARLQELKSRRDSLTEAEREEWERLVEAAFDATVTRTQALPLAKS
jgi:hypothetical protein